MNTVIETLPEAIQSTDIAILNDTASPMSAYSMVLSQGGDIKDLKEMLEFQQMYEAMEAKKAFTRDMAAFKANPPRIVKDNEVSFNKTHYKHATLGNVTEKINKALAEHGFSSGWKTEQAQSSITVTCTITHKLGHSESTALVSPADNSGGKNSIQAIGSTITYLQRYTLLALTGLATHDQDDDGHGSEPKPLSFLDKMKSFAVNNNAAYMQILNKWQIDSARKITNPQAQEEIIKEIKAAIKNPPPAIDITETKEGREWIDTKEAFPEITGTMPEPVTPEQCAQAVAQVKQIINKGDAK